MPPSAKIGRMDLPERLVDVFAREHRRRIPGLLESVVITGSAALDDWHAGVSDIDVVMVIARPMTGEEMSEAKLLHAESKSSIAIDGIYLTEAQLSDGPDMVATAPQVIAGELIERQAGGELTWVTWREMENGREAQVNDAGARDWRRSQRRFPAAFRGAQQFSRENLAGYWAALGVQSRTQLTALEPDAPVNADTVRWIALGPARLVATIETGEVLSKTAAAGFATKRWPQYGEVLARAAASRAGIEVVFTAADAELAIDLLDQCVAAGSGASAHP